jgi:hypothetical protein
MSDADGGGVGLGGALGISAQPCDGPSGGDGDAGLDAAFAQLRQIVPLFAAMANPPNRAKMQTALQHHRGGAACLPAKYRRKHLAGHEYLIVSNPSRGALLAAWSQFVAPGRGGAGRGEAERGGAKRRPKGFEEQQEVNSGTLLLGNPRVTPCKHHHPFSPMAFRH